MADSHRDGSALLPWALFAGGLVVGSVVAARRQPPTDARSGNLLAYLTDHLTGSDSAITVVTRLASSLRGTPEGGLFAELQREFGLERRVLRRVLRRAGGAPASAKRAAGYTAGAMLQAVSGGEPGSLALFRTLEALLIGVQGKRCLWRALRSAGTGRDDAATFTALEERAIGQWRRLEDLRQRRVPQTFECAARYQS